MTRKACLKRAAVWVPDNRALAAKLDELDKKILSDSVSPGDSSQAATIAAISTSTLSSLEAAQGLIGNDPDSASATVHGDTENRALAALSRVREEVKILDLNISHSGPFSEHEDSNESETYSASLASLLHLQRYVSARKLPDKAR